MIKIEAGMGSTGLPNMASLHLMCSAVSQLADSVSVTSLIGKEYPVSSKTTGPQYVYLLHKVKGKYHFVCSILENLTLIVKDQ